MMNFRFFLGAALTSLLVSLSASAGDQPANEFVEARHAEFVRIVKEKGSFSEAINRYFDAKVFTQRAFGSEWDGINNDENAEKIAQVGEKLKTLFHRKLQKKIKSIKDYHLEGTHIADTVGSVDQVDAKAKKDNEKKDVELSYYVSNDKFVDVAVEHASPSSKSYYKAFMGTKAKPGPFKTNGLDGVLEYLDKQLKK